MEWISVNDSLPDMKGKWRETVLVYGSPQCGTHSKDWRVMEAYFRRKNGENFFEFGEYDCPLIVTHWMPLPQPPEEI